MIAGVPLQVKPRRSRGAFAFVGAHDLVAVRCRDGKEEAARAIALREHDADGEVLAGRQVELEGPSAGPAVVEVVLHDQIGVPTLPARVRLGAQPEEHDIVDRIGVEGVKACQLRV